VTLFRHLHPGFSDYTESTCLIDAMAPTELETALNELTEAMTFFEEGAVALASAYLGFRVDGPLSQGQAEKFHKFVLPIMGRVYGRIKGDSENEKSFKDFYERSTPAEFLLFLLRNEVIDEAINSEY